MNTTYFQYYLQYHFRFENVIPDFVFDDFINKFENVDSSEGFDNIVGIDGLKGLKKTQKIKRKMR